MIIVFAVGMVLGGLGLYFTLPLSSPLIAQNPSGSHGEAITGNSANNDPLYWVAPMDPNFKRDKPGKSPMGMDLVPVFEDGASNDSPGTVKVDPVTINNLGVKTQTVKAIIPFYTIRAFGRVSFAEDAIVHIHPRVEGWIETLHVRNQGEYVSQGEPLYSLYSPELVNAQEELLIALGQNNKPLISAAKARLTALNAPLSLINRLQKKREVERTITFTAPQSGFVSTLNIREGFYVSPATTMLAIANMEQVWVMADIFASDAGKIEVGQVAQIISEHLPNTEISASIDYIYPTLDMNTRTMRARFIVDNPELMLKPDMFTTVVIEAQPVQMENMKRRVVVPQQAIIRTGQDERVVLALGDGKFKSIHVQLGNVYDKGVEVVEGLQEGDEIVISAQFLLDSESSISSDFMRMIPTTNKDENENEDLTLNDKNISAWTKARVNKVMLSERMVNLTHGPLDAFDMMGMTMNFMVSDDIDIAQFVPSQEVHVEMIKTPSGMYSIKTVHFMEMQEHSDKASHENHGETAL